MAKDHYLPATYIAIFSSILKSPRRKSQVWVGHKPSGRIFLTSAENICHKNDFYTLASDLSVDKDLSAYEKNLHKNLEKLINRSIDGKEWADQLVKFVAAILVKNQDFEARFNSRFPEKFSKYLTEDNLNFARIMEFKRLQPLIAAADWIVLESSGNFKQLTSDLGFMPFKDDITGKHGFCIPIGPKHILNITPNPINEIVIGFKNKWVPKIGYYSISDEVHLSFLNSMARWSQELIISSDKATIEKYLIETKEKYPIPDPEELGFNRGQTPADDTIMDRLIFYLSKKPINDLIILININVPDFIFVRKLTFMQKIRRFIRIWRAYVFKV